MPLFLPSGGRDKGTLQRRLPVTEVPAERGMDGEQAPARMLSHQVACRSSSGGHQGYQGEKMSLFM